MATIRKMIYENEPLTQKQIKQIEAADRMPPVSDDDCPELTDQQLKELAAMAAQQRAERCRPLLTIRVNQDTLAKAKALGRGYTGIVGRLVDLAINNPDLLKRCL